jgi:hypothetical protein
MFSTVRYFYTILIFAGKAGACRVDSRVGTYFFPQMLDKVVSE